MSPRLALFAPLIVFVVVAPFLWLALDRDPNELPSARIGEPFPAFSLSSLEDPKELLNTADMRGQVALVNVWATWCYACRIEHAMLNELALMGVKIIGLNYKDNRQEATRWLDQLGDPYAFSIFDAQGSLGLDLGVYGAPETYLLDAKGIIQYRRVGVLDQRSWQREFAERYQLLVSGDVE